MNLKGKIIKHNRFMDIAFKVGSVNMSNGIYNLKGFLINQAYVQSFIMEYKEFNLDNFDDWLICDQPELKCIRYSTWTPVVKTN